MGASRHAIVVMVIGDWCLTDVAVMADESQRASRDESCRMLTTSDTVLRRRLGRLVNRREIPEEQQCLIDWWVL